MTTDTLKQTRLLETCERLETMAQQGISELETVGVGSSGYAAVEARRLRELLHELRS